MEINESAPAYRRYTCEEVDSWDSEEMFELIDGELYHMSSPGRIHQKISMGLSMQLGIFLRGKPCEVYCAPFDVYLNKDNQTRLIPDIIVVCDESKLIDKGCFGEPDLVVEILSKSSLRRDKITKFNRYLDAGVREYWIVDPVEKIVSVYLLKGGEYVAKSYSEADTI